MNPKLNSLPFNYKEAFSRNIGIVSEGDQTALSEKCVALPGCGGVGGIHAKALARAGIGRFSIADFDTFETANLNRQYGAKQSTMGKNKADVIENEIYEINPDAVVRSFRNGIDDKNIEDFLKGVDLIVDGLDFFAFNARDILYETARRKNIPIITAAPLGFSCGLLYFSPEKLSFSEYFNFNQKDSSFVRALKFAVGLAPAMLHRSYIDPKSVDFKASKGPSHVVGVTLCAAMATAEAVNFLLKRPTIRPVPHYYQFDAYKMRMRKGYLWGGNKNPVQKFKIWFAEKWLLRGHATK